MTNEERTSRSFGARCFIGVSSGITWTDDLRREAGLIRNSAICTDVSWCVQALAGTWFKKAAALPLTYAPKTFN